MTPSPEWLVLGLNGALVLLSYTLVYPKVAGADGMRLAQLDVLLSAFASLVVWLAWGADGRPFSAFGVEVGWFTFTLVSYLLIEMPVAAWYYKKHGVLASFKRGRDQVKAKD